MGQWLSDWVIDSFRFEDSYRISELCKLVHLKFISALHYPLQNFEKMQFLLFAIHTRFDISKFDPCYFSFVLFKNYKKIYISIGIQICIHCDNILHFTQKKENASLMWQIPAVMEWVEVWENHIFKLEILNSSHLLVAAVSRISLSLWRYCNLFISSPRREMLYFDPLSHPSSNIFWQKAVKTYSSYFVFF